MADHIGKKINVSHKTTQNFERKNKNTEGRIKTERRLLTSNQDNREKGDFEGKGVSLGVEINKT